MAFHLPVGAQAPLSSISGVVVTDDATPRPVRRALVTLAGAEAPRGGGRTVVTDDSGRFVIQPIAPGRYTLSVARPGFITTSYGARRTGRPGTPIQIAAGQRIEGITVRLPRGAVVTGTVLDQAGSPLPSVSVVLMKYVYSTQSGERSLQMAELSSTTDDRGVYRIYGIAPGEYLARLTPPISLPGEMRQTTEQSMQAALQWLRSPPGSAAPPRAVQAPPVAYASTFYPGVTSPADAAALTLAAGDERAGVDFQLELVPTARIEGVVTGPDGSPASTAQVTILGAGPVETSVPAMIAAVLGGGRTDAEGRFTLSGISPGRYTVAARTGVAARQGGPPGSAPPVAAGPVMWAMADVDVNGQDVSGLRLTLEPGMRVAGRMVFRGAGTPPADLTAARVTLTPLLSGASVAAVVPPAQPDAEGRFAFEGVTPGRYRVGATLPAASPSTAVSAAEAPAPPASATAASWALTSATARGQETLDTGLVIRPHEPVGDATLVFGDRPTTLSGTLQDATGRPASEYFVVVYATDKTFWTPPSRRVAMARPGSDGRFTVRSLPPGDYQIAAVTDVAQGEWMDPSFLAQLVAASIRVSLAEGETKTQDIRIAGGR